MPATFSVERSNLLLQSPSAISGSLRIGADSPYAVQDWSPAETSITFGQRIIDAYLRLLDACADAAKDEATEPVAATAYTTAEVILAALPPGIPLPEISVHSDGEIALEWHETKRRVLTLSIGDEGSLAFAGLFETSTIYGTEVFDGSIPSPIEGFLARLYPPPPAYQSR